MQVCDAAFSQPEVNWAKRLKRATTFIAWSSDDIFPAGNEVKRAHPPSLPTDS